MQRKILVNLGNLLLSLSDALDLASPSLAHHQQRVAFIVWEMGKAAKIPVDRLERSFFAALLHDIGAFSLEEKISLRNNCSVENISEHCSYGELVLRKLPWLQESASIVRFHHRPWKDWDEPIDNPLVFDSQLLALADHLERSIDRRQYILHQHEQIRSDIRQQTTLLHPQIIALFLEVTDREEFWLDLISPRLYSLLLHNGPYRKMEIDLDNITSIAELFRTIIDFRSRFTATHSAGVSAAASMLGRLFGFTGTEVRLLEIAGDLHDIGKLAIPNSILDKPGKLTKDEFAVVKSHPYYTYSILDTIGGLQQIVEWSAYHHEKLDGTGYPFHCPENELSFGARILAVADVFTALAEDRPYRTGMAHPGIKQVIQQLSACRHLDPGVVALLLRHFDDIFAHVQEQQAVARIFYENQFLSCPKN